VGVRNPRSELERERATHWSCADKIRNEAGAMGRPGRQLKVELHPANHMPVALSPSRQGFATEYTPGTAR